MVADLIPCLRSHRIWEQGSQAWWWVEGAPGVSSRRLGLYVGRRVNRKFLQSAPGKPSENCPAAAIKGRDSFPSVSPEAGAMGALATAGAWETSPGYSVISNFELSWWGLETALGLLCKALRANFLKSADSNNSPDFFVLFCFVFSDYFLP